MAFWQHGAGQKGKSDAYPISTGDTASVDAFARWRISSPFTLFDSKQIWDDPDLANTVENFPLFWDNQQTSGGGTSTSFNVNRASTTLSVSANTAGTRVRQTRQRFNYLPGKSQLVILTGRFGKTGSGVTKRYGLFDDNNGLFLQDSGGTWSVAVRSSASGAAVDTVVSQSDWNLDKLDGTGPSGVTLDKQNVQIFFVDFEWLGVGRVRFGFFIGGVPIYCHKALHANRITSVYMSTPNLPIRGEISNAGTGAADSIELICTTVISEGGSELSGNYRSANLGADGAAEIQANTINTTYAICGIRLKTAYLSAAVREVAISIIETTAAGNNFLWQLHLNPTLTIGLSYANVANSAVQFGVGAPAGDVITAVGVVIGSGYVSSAIEQATINVESALRLGSLIDGTQDQLVLSVTPITANLDILGGLTWREAW